MMIDPRVYQQPLLKLSRRAGEAIAEIYGDTAKLAVELKGDNSPITIADKTSHSLLVTGLREFEGGYPILSEESNMPEWSERRKWQTYWLVDPLDGTKEFIDRTGDFTINIALIHQHKSILGLIYLPMAKRAYLGVPGQFAISVQGSESVDLCPRVTASDSELIMQTSRRHRGEALDQCRGLLERHFPKVSRQYVGSALKFCHLAEGRADIYPRFSPCSEWDTAAGQALLEAVGGQLLDLNFLPLSYNRKSSLINPDFYALANGNFDWEDVLSAEFSE
jgi:3'(2'), 5'-bisphosphate nucleotidase